MPEKNRYQKRKKDKQTGIPYVIIAVLIILIGFVFVSVSNSSEVYSFCEELEHLNTSENNYTELRNELKKLCGKELSQRDQELGNLSMEFLKSLSNFNESWKENESITMENAKKIDDVYSNIKRIDDNSSGISTQVESVYMSKVDGLDRELKVQNIEIENVTSLVDQLEERNNSLTAALNKSRAEEKARKDEERTLSLIYSQRKNESIDIESILSFSKNEYDKTKSNFKNNLLPIIFVGIALGGIIGAVLCFKWRNEKRYWDAYSSSAKVSSPLKLVALLTIALLVILFFYLLMSGKSEAILI